MIIGSGKNLFGKKILKEFPNGLELVILVDIGQLIF